MYSSRRPCNPRHAAFPLRCWMTSCAAARTDSPRNRSAGKVAPTTTACRNRHRVMVASTGSITNLSGLVWGTGLHEPTSLEVPQ
eukprot:15473772-Alexandrium_andersonii.AAC.1